MGIHIKNEAEIQAMREGGKILGQILSELVPLVVPGNSTMDIERAAEKLFEKYNVVPGFKGYHGYPAILCTSVNDEAVHTIPNDRPLEEGDLINIDCGVLHKKLNTDSAMALTVGKASPEIEHFKDTCIRALWAGIRQVKPGNRVGDIGHAIANVARDAGYSIIKELTGHGVGYTLHEEPHVFNFGKRGKGAALKPGMVIAIEPILAMGNGAIETLEDGWNIVTKDGSPAIQHEHTVLVTETGYEILTLRPGETPA